ncbi:MAG: TldD/PmbA family protein [Dehalococcoidia bacterium]|nr:TldD/PmbA family protein [Dehalococcoidia bacterium]
MLEEKDIKRALDAALAYSKADATEVSIFAEESALTRFANNYIHQNVAERGTGLLVKAVVGRRVGIASADNIEERILRSTIDKAIEIAEFQPDNPQLAPLASPSPYSSAQAYSERTAGYSPEDRAKSVAIICKLANEKDFTAAGAFSNSLSQMAIANSQGLYAYRTQTDANFNTVVMGPDGSGYAERWAVDIGEIEPESVAAEALDKTVRSQRPIDIEPGEYTVILEEYAVSDILDFLAYLSFSALAVQEGRSFMAGRFGERVMGENISIWDDALGEGTVATPFDFEGVPARRVDLILNGVANAACYDLATAHKENKESTGHGLTAGSTFGPVPRHLFLGPGNTSKEEMLASTKHGIWVTRFHYTRVVHPMTLHVTGMTRDGTFLIRDGEIVAPVKNLRFTQSYLEALNNVEAIGRETRLTNTMFSYNRTPALKIAKWDFTGVTEF